MATTSDNQQEPALVAGDADLRWRALDNSGAEVETLINGVHVHLPLIARADGDGVTWHVTIDMVDGRLACTSLDVSRLPGGPTVTTELIRSFAVARQVYRVVKANLWVAAAPGVDSGPSQADLLAQGPTDAALEYVATVYHLADVCSLKPTKAVEELGLTRRTAERWIQAARQKGML